MTTAINNFCDKKLDGKYLLTSPTLAVSIQNASKAYQKGNSILKNLNMRVPESTIYGLLGASGCGKTTILSCIVGLKKLDKGEIRIFDKTPRSIGSDIPGRLIGYMPQDIALYGIFTIEEILQYYGRIYGMTRNEIKVRMNFVITLLDLPNSTSIINTLSGGGQRRTSLAVAMIHAPKLLILDEPTVGVDPLLRERIWSHLHDEVQKYGTTVIITTHYIEEAKQSGRIGIMRSGHLISEECPQALLNYHGTQSLEEIYLKLSREDEATRILKLCTKKDSFFKSIDNVEGLKLIKHESSYPDLISLNKARFDEEKLINFSPRGSHMDKILALAIRNFLTFLRHPWFTICLILIPLMQTALVSSIVGYPPKYTSLGIVNHEIMESYYEDQSIYEFCKRSNQSGCFINDHVSCRYINLFMEEEITWVSYSTESEAIESVKLGKTWGYISIPGNYTKLMWKRVFFGNLMTNKTLVETIIKARLDFSSKLMARFVLLKLLENLQLFNKNLISDCNGDPRKADLAFQVNALYGDQSRDFGVGSKEFLQPGLLIMLMLILPMASAQNYIQDKKSGNLDRSITAGIEYIHLITAFMITEGCLLATQLALTVTSLIYIFDSDIQGSVMLFFIICFLQGLTGVSFGFLIGTSFDYELPAILVIMALYVLHSFSTGVAWPLEGLSEWTQTVCDFLPTTLPIKSLRSVVDHEDWGILHARVWPGLASMVTWIILLCILSGIVRKIKSNV